MKCLAVAALVVCSKAPKNVDMHWMVGKEDASQEMRGNISRAAKNAEEILEMVHDPENEEHKRAKELVRVARRRYQRKNRRWERQYWNSNIEEAKMAQERNDIGTMYKLLVKLGPIDSKSARASEQFSSEEYKEHFSKVSAVRHENTLEMTKEVLERIPEMEDRKKTTRELEKDLTKREIKNAISEMKNGAPGEDEVRITYVRRADERTKNMVIELVQQIYDTPPLEWEACVKTGLVIPLFKKGQRNNLNYYRVSVFSPWRRESLREYCRQGFESGPKK